MAPVPFLLAKQEVEAARQIEALDRALWAQLLRYPPQLEWILGTIERGDTSGRFDWAKLRRAARRAGSGVVRRRRHERQCELAAEHLQERDVDRRRLLAVCGELERRFPRETMDRKPYHDGSGSGDCGGDYYRQVLALSAAAQRARDAFVKANLRLVVSIAGRFHGGFLPLADLIQEGNIGLIKAVERFDYRRGYRFSTYASWWIRHSIIRAISDHGRVVRIPVHLHDAHYKASRARGELSSKLGRAPTREEIGFSADLGPGKVELVQGGLFDQSLSLDRAISEEDDRRFIELLMDPNSASPTEKFIDRSVSEQVQQLLGALTPIQADVLRRRFGLGGGEVLTLQEIGDSYQLTRERIRQIQQQALGKIQGELVRMRAL